MTDKELYDRLTYENKNAYLEMTEEQKREMSAFCDDYRAFLDNGKTERECVREALKLAEAAGYRDLDDVSELKPGDRIYKINRGKNILLAVIGTEDIKKGINIAGAHIDSPRLDLKQNPIYESTDMALLKTHYYGGIKKYQWPTIPLAIHGVIYDENGEKHSLFESSDGYWREDDGTAYSRSSSKVFQLKDGSKQVKTYYWTKDEDDGGEEGDPYSAPSVTIYGDDGEGHKVYESSDGYWREDDGTAYVRNSFKEFQLKDGSELFYMH